MRRFLVCAAILLVGSLARAQSSSTGNITAQGTTCATTNACISDTLPTSVGLTASTASIAISGNSSGNTLQFESTGDGVTWIAINALPVGGGSAVTSTTATSGTWQLGVASLIGVRVRCSTFVSGTVTVTITAAASSGLNSAASVINLFSTCSGTQYLGADGACHTSGGGAGTVAASPQFQIPYYDQAGTTAHVLGDSLLTTDGSGNLTDASTTSSGTGAGVYDFSCGSFGFSSLSFLRIGCFTGNVPVGSVNGGPFLPFLTASMNIPNTTVTGTLANSLTSLTTSNCTANTGCAIRTAGGATGGVIGITIAGQGTSGNAQIITSGYVSCAFDSSGATAVHYVGISATAGDCTDAGSTLPTSGQVLGRVVCTATTPCAASAGNYLVDLFPSELQGVTNAAANVTSVFTRTGAVTATSGDYSLDLISALAASKSDSNGNNTLTWQSAQTSNTQSSILINESAAATNGTYTNNVPNQTSLQIETAGGSTASPVLIGNSLTGSQAACALCLNPTWNTTGTVIAGIYENVTNTASNAASKLLELDTNTGGAPTSQFAVTEGGGVSGTSATFNGTQLIGAAPGKLQSAAPTSNLAVVGGQDTNAATTTIGTLTVRGGDITATSGTNVPGTVTVRGGNCSAASGFTSCTPATLNVTGGGFTTGYTNAAAADVIIGGGLGTGTGAPSHVKLQSPPLGLSSGTTAQTEVTRFTSHAKAGSTTSATATTIFNIASATNTTWGVDIVVHVQLISSTPNVCGTTERFSLTGTNNNGAFGTVNVVAGTLSTLCSTGTLTLAVTATAANPSVISVTPTWGTITSITSDTIDVVIENPSGQDITLL